MLKKVLWVLVVLLLCFSCSLHAFALTDEQGWILTYQIQNLPEEYRELYGAYYSEETVTAKNVLYGDWGTGPEGILIQELFDAGAFIQPEYSSNNPEWENNPDVTSAPASEVKRVYEEAFGPGSFEYFKHKESFTKYGDRFRYNAERIKEILDEAKNPVQSSTQRTFDDSATDTVADEEDTSATVVPDERGSDEKRNISILIWVCIGAAAIALVCMFVPVVRKKKQK